jgi:hypothetical protein
MAFWDSNVIINVKEAGYVLDFSFTCLLQAFTWCLCPSQPVSVFRHAPSVCSLLPIGSGYSEPNLFPYKHPNSLVPVILLTPPMSMEQTEGSEMSAYDFGRWGVTQKKEYNIVGYGLFSCGAGQDHEVGCCEQGSERLVFMKGG